MFIALYSEMNARRMEVYKFMINLNYLRRALFSKTDLEVRLYVCWNAAESAVLPVQLWAVRRYRKQPVVSSNVSRMPVSFQMLRKW